MTQAKHTPGPWVLGEKKDTYFRIYGKGATIAKVDICVNKEQISPSTFREKLEEGEANARLIAAAPELLEALKMAANFNWKNNRTHLLEIVNVAIAKAKGL